MRILITNDDGIEAPGFATITRIAEQLVARFGGEVWAVAPQSNQSGLAHSLTLHDPLRVREVAERRYYVTGTPTDCVIMAVRELMPSPPDLILSGVNAGENSGDDVTYSGTVAAAIEGTMLGIPSIALSQAFDYWADKAQIPFETAEALAPDLIAEVLKIGILPGTLININFPPCKTADVKGVKIARQGTQEHAVVPDGRTDAFNRPYYWLTFQRREKAVHADSDLQALADGYVAVTPLQLDLTDHASLARLSSLAR